MKKDRTKNNTKIKYDAEADVLSLETSPKAKIDYATEVGNIVVHFTEKNVPVLVEVLEASKFLEQSERIIEKEKALATVN